MKIDIEDLPPTVSVTMAAEILGISRKHAYLCVSRGEIPIIRLGHRVVVPTRALISMLGATSEGR
jgi:excisionase family DNA binding protein